MSFSGTDRFEIVRRIGEGGMGVVYEAIDREHDAPIALKTIRDLSPQGLYRLKNEFRSLVDLRHPNLIELGELYEEQGEWFFTMELVRGVDIITYLQRPSSARAEPAAGAGAGRLREIFAQLAEALTVLHRADLVHRDIKPSNVLVSDAGRVVLLDFGLATGLADDQSRDGGIVGTAAYMAPEQAAAKIVGAEADWYAFGVLLYEALCGRTPFEGPPLKVLVDKQQSQPPAPRSIAGEVAEDLDELCTRLLRFDPEERPAEDKIQRVLAAPGQSSSPRAVSSSATVIAPFVGRIRELAELGETFAAVRSGRGATVVISGASGVGKSMLANNFVKSVSRDSADVVVLSGRCYESETVPFKAVDGVIDSLSRYLRRDSGDVDAVLPLEAALLPRVFPVLGRVEQLARAPLPRRPAEDAHELRARVFKALRELIHRLAMRVPLIITIDDLQWADADSLNLIRALVAPPDAPPMLVLSTLRPVSRPHAWTVATLAIPGKFRELALGHLDEEDARKLVTLLLENVGAEADPARIAREAEGHPLFIDELVRHLATSSESRGPVRLDQAIWRRISALAEQSRAIVELVAIAAAPLAADVICRAASADARQFRRQIAVLRVSHLVSATGSRNSDLLEPYHDRVREAVVNNLPGEARAELHRRLARALETSGRAELHAEFLVHHLEGAGEFGRAAEYAERAAERAARLLAFDRAALLYRTALRIGGGEDEHRRALNSALGEVLISAGNCGEGARALIEAVEGAEPALRRKVRVRAAEQLLISGHIEEGTGVLSALLDEMGLSMPPSPQAALRALIWTRLKLALRGLWWRRKSEAEIAPATLLRVDTLKAIGTGLSMVDNIRGADYNARFLLLALRVGETSRIAAALASEAVFLSSQGGRGFARGRKLARRVATASPDEEFMVNYSVIIGAVVDYFAGDFAAADVSLCESLPVFEKHSAGANFQINNGRLFLCFTARHLGKLELLRERFAVYVADASGRGDRYLESCLRRISTLVLLADDDLDGAREQLALASWVPAEDDFHVPHWYELEAVAELALYEGRIATARAELATMFDQLWASLVSRVQIIRVLASWLEGRMLLSVARDDAGAARLHKLVRALKRERVPYARVAAALLAGAVRASKGDAAGARKCLEQGIDHADGIGMNLVAASARLAGAELVGGAEGEAMAARAYDYFSAEKVVVPERMIRVFAPGFRA